MRISKIVIILIIFQMVSCSSNKSVHYTEYRPSQKLIEKKENVLFEKYWNRWDRKIEQKFYLVDRKELIPRHQIKAILMEDPSPEVIQEVQIAKKYEMWSNIAGVIASVFLLAAAIGTTKDDKGNSSFSAKTNTILWGLTGATFSGGFLLVNQQHKHIDKATDLHSNRIKKEKGIGFLIGTTF